MILDWVFATLVDCSMDKGWLNPPLRFADEPCRHKLLDLIGDLSLSALPGHAGLPIGHIVAFKVVLSWSCMLNILWTNFPASLSEGSGDMT